MEGIRRSGRPSVPHGDEPESRIAAAEVAEPAGGRVARLFALVQEFDDDNDRPVREVVAYGMALPSGHTMTVTPSGAGIHTWQSPHSASRRLGSELVWLV